MEVKSISVIGLGRLGLAIAAVKRRAGFDVIGVDISENIVQSINSGNCPISETGLAELLKEYPIRATTNTVDAVLHTDATFVIVNTPSRADGGFSNKYISEVCREIGKALKLKDSYHLVVITSTIMPGTMQEIVKPTIESFSGKKCHKDFGLLCNPEFIALGSVVRDMTNPDSILIGGQEQKDIDTLIGIQRRICVNSPVIHQMSWWNAEVAKIALNVSLTMKITFANQIARAAESIPGGDVDKILSFVGSDSRIGKKFLQSGLGYSGTCLPRDNRAFASFAESRLVKTTVPKAVDTENTRQRQLVADRIVKILVANKEVAVLGVTFKPNTEVIEESGALTILKTLAGAGKNIRCYDPKGMDNARKRLEGLKIQWCPAPEYTLFGADICVIATPWPEFRNLDLVAMKRDMRTPIIFDCWRLLDRKSCEDAGLIYKAVGISEVF